MTSDERKRVAMELRALCCEIKRADAELEEELSYLSPGGEGKRKAIEDALRENRRKRREYLSALDEMEGAPD